LIFSRNIQLSEKSSTPQSGSRTFNRFGFRSISQEHLLHSHFIKDVVVPVEERQCMAQYPQLKADGFLAKHLTEIK